MNSGAEVAMPVLTDTERRVLRMYADGNTSREIAKAISKSPRTVEYYRQGLCRRLNAANLPQLIDKAWRAGLLG